MNFIPNSLEQLYQCPLSSADLTQLSQKGIDMIAQLYIQRPVNINLQITYTDLEWITLDLQVTWIDLQSLKCTDV